MKSGCLIPLLAIAILIVVFIRQGRNESEEIVDMALRYDIDFEVGDFTEFDNVPATTTALFVTAVSPIQGSESASTNWKSNPQEVATNDMNALAALSNTWRFGMRVRIDSMSFGTLQTQTIFFSISGSTTLIGFRMEKSGTDIVATLFDLAASQSSAKIDDAAEHTIEGRIIQESFNGAGDGSFSLWVDGLFVGTQSGLTNFTNFNAAKTQVSNFQLASLRIISGAGHSGGFLVDDIIFRDDDTQIFPPGGGTVSQVATVADIFKSVDIDADGANLYIAGLNSSSQPTLVKMSTDLDTDASSVFDPGDGTNIGIQCGRFDADVVYIAGTLGGTNTVMKSTNGGTSFTVIDDGTFGDVLTFVVGPDSDDRVLIYDGDNAAIEETIDSGTSWTEHDTAIDTAILSIARLPINVQEVVFGNATDAPNSNIEYSPNSGATREDYDAGFPEADVTSVIVNQ